MLVKYYLRSSKKTLTPTLALPLLFPQQEISHVSAQKIKLGVQTLLKQHLTQEHLRSHIDMSMSMHQFLQFKAATIQELIFWHGNQFLTGAPFYPGGIPNIIYFQWGNLFGVVKVNILSGEKNMLGNVLVYFEDKDERNFSECIKEYEHHHKDEIIETNKLQLQNQHQEAESVIYQPPQPHMRSQPPIIEIDSE